MRDFRRLDVWKRAIDLAEEVYRITGSFPKEEIYGLTSQLRRASISVSSNIAEGCGKRTKKDFIRFLDNAMGSIMEIESQFIISEKLGYIEDVELSSLVRDLRELAKMMTGFIKYISGLDLK